MDTEVGSEAPIVLRAFSAFHVLVEHLLCCVLFRSRRGLFCRPPTELDPKPLLDPITLSCSCFALFLSAPICSTKGETSSVCRLNAF